MSESNKFWDVRHGKHTKVKRFANISPPFHHHESSLTVQEDGHRPGRFLPK